MAQILHFRRTPLLQIIILHECTLHPTVFSLILSLPIIIITLLVQSLHHGDTSIQVVSLNPHLLISKQIDKLCVGDPLVALGVHYF